MTDGAFTGNYSMPLLAL